ncbi:MAG: hypothetical protein JSR96_01215 [Proteobacteria bacterium]|nr:hypothetical protein [Pseudomonadota bacterium]
MALAVVVIGIIVAMGMAVEGYKSRLRVKERELELRLAEVQARAALPAPADDRIEQRLRVLERIATDKGPDLAAEIEKLRDGSKSTTLTDLREKEFN